MQPARTPLRSNIVYGDGIVHAGLYPISNHWTRQSAKTGSLRILHKIALSKNPEVGYRSTNSRHSAEIGRGGRGIRTEVRALLDAPDRRVGSAFRARLPLRSAQSLAFASDKC